MALGLREASADRAEDRPDLRPKAQGLTPNEAQGLTPPRLAYRCPSADADLLREELGLEAEFRVAFELPLAGRILGTAGWLARRLSPAGQARLARWLSRLSAPLSRFGTDAGCLLAEFADETVPRAIATLTGTGQRLAILPCALALEALLNGELTQRGVLHPTTWLSSDDWIARLQTRGLQFEGHVP